jgi:hypothetical protein
MADGSKTLEGLTSHALARGVGGLEVWKGAFEVEEFAVEEVVLVIADGGLGEDVIGVVVLADLGGQFSVTVFGL